MSERRVCERVGAEWHERDGVAFKVMEELQQLRSAAPAPAPVAAPTPAPAPEPDLEASANPGDASGRSPVRTQRPRVTFGDMVQLRLAVLEAEEYLKGFPDVRMPVSSHKPSEPGSGRRNGRRREEMAHRAGSSLEWTAGSKFCRLCRDWQFVANANDRWHRTPLSYAIFRGHTAAARTLLAGGARLDWANPHPKVKQTRNNNFYSTSVHLAVQAAADFANADRREAESGSEQWEGWGCLQLLLSLPEVQSRLDTPDVSGRTALHTAAGLRIVGPGSVSLAAEGVAMLLAAGASPMVTDLKGWRPLDVAKVEGNGGEAVTRMLELAMQASA